MIYIVALGVGFKCQRKIHLNTQWSPPPSQYMLHTSKVESLLIKAVIFCDSSLVKAGRYVTAKGLSINDQVWVDFIHDFFCILKCYLWYVLVSWLYFQWITGFQIKLVQTMQKLLLDPKSFWDPKSSTVGTVVCVGLVCLGLYNWIYSIFRQLLLLLSQIALKTFFW